MGCLKRRWSYQSWYGNCQSFLHIYMVGSIFNVFSHIFPRQYCNTFTIHLPNWGRWTEEMACCRNFWSLQMHVTRSSILWKSFARCVGFAIEWICLYYIFNSHVIFIICYTDFTTVGILFLKFDHLWISDQHLCVANSCTASHPW